jgi:GntR family transcriptional regulator
VPTPLYRRIADQLRDAIFGGELEPGAQLPTEPELQERFGASRTTIRLALSALANEGLIETAGRRGTFVRRRVMLNYQANIAERADRPRAETDAYFEEVREAGHEPSQDFSMVIEPAGPDAATRLKVPEGDLVVARTCIRYVDGQPWSDQVSYYPMDIAQATGLTNPRDIPGGTVRAMADAGHVEIGHLDEVTARMPSPEEARSLDVGTGVPVLVYIRTAYTKERPVRVTRTIFPADRNRIMYELGTLPEGETTP